MLTKKQHRLLMFIHERIQASGICPSYDEMREALELKSKSGIFRMISNLTERGFLRRLENRARAVEIIRLPDNTNPDDLPHRIRMSTMERQQKEEQNKITNNINSNSVSVPLVGAIAAGLPLQAFQDPSSNIEIPQSLLGRGRHFALEVDGESMIEAGILNGDTVILEETRHAENNQIVAALVNREEVTLKRFFFRDGIVLLKAENSTYPTQQYRPDQVEIQGKMAALIRKY